MGFCEKMGKTLMFVFNAIFFLCGAVFLAIGIWIVVGKSSLVSVAAKVGANEISKQIETVANIQYAAYVLIVVGALAFLIGFCGCCGACKESVCLLRLYAFFVGLLLILQIVGVVLAAVYRKNIESALVDGLTKIQNESYVGLPNSKTSDSLALDTIMVTLECCGVNGAKDFTKNQDTNAYSWKMNGRKLKNGDVLEIPYACCKMTSTDFMGNGTYNKIADYRRDKECGLKLQGYNEIGCYDRIRSTLMKFVAAVIAVVIIIALIEILGIVITCCLIRSIDD